MMNDSVREELKDKISVAPRPLKVEARPAPVEIKPVTFEVRPANFEAKPAAFETKPATVEPKPAAPVVSKPAPPMIAKPQIPIAKPNTTEIAVKPTSPTLVEFQNKNAAVPEWRLQLQNAVRKRVEREQSETPFEAAPVLSRTPNLQTNGANALKAEAVQQTQPVLKGNAKLENALRRIEESRRRFLADEAQPEESKMMPETPAPAKNYPFRIASRNSELAPRPAEPRAPVNLSFKAKIDDLPVIERKEFDTTKLSSLPRPAAVAATNVERVAVIEPVEELETPEASVIQIKRLPPIDDELLELEEMELIEETEEEIEDLAPIAMRFNAGLFDLLIGSFAAMVLLSPLMLSGGNWYSLAGFLAFLVTCSIVMFIYMTTAIGLWGKTLGMKLFSLETIDIEENEYPTLHQAAVSSCAYLVSLALGGIGFLPALFNAERRTAPDLLSGTIVVREY